MTDSFFLKMEFKSFNISLFKLKLLEVSSSLKLGINNSRIVIIGSVNILATSLRDSLKMF